MLINREFAKDVKYAAQVVLWFCVFSLAITDTSFSFISTFWKKDKMLIGLKASKSALNSVLNKHLSPVFTCFQEQEKRCHETVEEF